MTYDSSKKVVYVTDGSYKVYLCAFGADFNTFYVQSSVTMPFNLLNELEFV